MRKGVKALSIDNNNLTTIPMSIILCKNLKYFNYDNNEITYIELPSQIQNFFKNLVYK
jgi:Leucine-rich repeat (LRR) protein